MTGRPRSRPMRVGVAAGLGVALATTALLVRAYAWPHRGLYVHGFEASEFRPCDGDGTPWWLGAASAGAFAPLRAAAEAQPQRPGAAAPPLYVRVTGWKRGPGRYGHVGAYAHTLVVTRVLEARRARPGECGVPLRPPRTA